MTAQRKRTARHTPVPWFANENGLARNNIGETQWTIGPTGHCLATVHRRTNDGAQMEADARFIVQACNSHEELVSALRYMVENAEADGWSSFMLSEARALLARVNGGAS